MNQKLNIHKKKIEKCFNRATDTYDQYSYPQQMIGRELIELLSKYENNYFDRIIDLGCGTGIVTEQLAKKYGYQHLYAIDIVNAFIIKAEQRLNAYGVQVHLDDFEKLAFKNTRFNLAFSNMALHWSIEFARTLSHIREYLINTGILAFTIPLAGHFCELTTDAKNSFYQFEEIQHYIHMSGFELLKGINESHVFGFDTWEKALKSIKATGSNYLFMRDKKSLGGNPLFSFKNNLMLRATLTYQIGYFICRKK